MPIAAVEFYDVVKWLHISVVVVALGPTFAFGIYQGVAAGRDPRSLPVVFAATEAINRYLVTIGGIVIFLTGIYLTIDGPWSFGDVFVNVGIVVLILLLGLVHAYFIPNDRSASEAAQRDIEAARGGAVELGSEFASRTRRSAQLGMLAGLVVVLTIYLMTAKPFL